MEFKEFKGKTVEDAITQATIELGAASTELETEVVDKGSTGFLGIGSKPAIIRARVKNDIVRDTKEYLEKLFKAMEIEAKIDISYDAENSNMDIDVEGPEMGILIGKRGQTLDSLQYLISLFVNKKSESYIRVKLDTENYRARRKETLENLAKNIAFKVKRSRRPFTLEPMNPFERRIIHSTLQGDKFVATRSEGEEPYRRVVVYLKKSGNKDK
jgi:spoIIIJ-associated protein